ncbi:MAG: amidohydrolase family protein [Chitinophagaceae bacterium]|nr:amidohydrolase family protein [Chitinophagaceae bacterium]
MHYRKFVADHLFTGRRMLDDQYALIARSDGEIEGIIEKKDAGEDIETYKGILSPGWINCHCHLELSHLKGIIPEHTGMTHFLLSVMSRRNIALPRIMEAIEEAERQMVNAGIVAVGDICNTPHTLSQKSKGNLVYHNFVETMGFQDALADNRFEQALQLYKTFAGMPVSIAPHAPYSVSRSLLALINDYPGNEILTIHNQESEEENVFFRSGGGAFPELFGALGIDISGFHPSGKSSLQTCLPSFEKKDSSLILVHNVATSAEDLQWTAHYRLRYPLPELYWCLCPGANQYIQGRLPDIDLLLSNGCKLTLGSDSLASNHRLDILEELKTIQRHFPHITLADLLQWATLNGAEALHIQDRFGSFDPGKSPGILLIEEAENQRLSEHTRSRRLL